MKMELKYLTLLTLIIQNTASVVLTRVSRMSSGDKEMYSASVAVLMDELIKLIFCLIMIFVAYRKEKKESSFFVFLKVNVFKLESFLHIAVPAVCFAIQKNLIFIAVSNLDAATFQVAAQGKILTTALFSYLILNNELSRRQVFALFLLLFGVCLVQFEISQRASKSSNPNDDPFIGFLAISGVCISSGFASVYFEWILKKSSSSGNHTQSQWYDIWIKNFQLAILTGTPASIPVLLNENDIMNPFRGFTLLVWFVVLLSSAGGLLVALVIKYADNILKNFASGIVSALFLGFNVTFGFVVGTCFVIFAVYSSSHPPSIPSAPAKVKTIVIKKNIEGASPIE